MNSRLAIGLTLVSALAVSGVVALWLSSERIEQHAVLGALRHGTSDEAVAQAIAELYQTRPVEADRLMVRILMEQEHQNHERLIRMLESSGREAVVPIPPRQRHARAVLADLDAEEAHRSAEADFLATKGTSELESSLPLLSCDRVLYRRMRPWWGKRLLPALLEVAGKGEPVAANQALRLIAVAKRDPELTPKQRISLAQNLTALLARQGLDAAAVLRAAGAHGSLRSKAAFARLGPHLRGVAREPALALLLASIRASPSLAAVAPLLRGPPLPAEVRLALAGALPLRADSLPLLLTLASSFASRPLLAAIVRKLADMPPRLLAVLTPAQHLALARELDRGLSGTQDVGQLPAEIARLLRALSKIEPYLALTGSLLRRARTDPSAGTSAIRALAALCQQADGASLTRVRDPLLALALDPQRRADLRLEALRALQLWKSSLPLDGLTGSFSGARSPALRGALLELLVGRRSDSLVPFFRKLLATRDGRIAAGAARGLVLCSGASCDGELIALLDRRPELAQALLPALALTGTNRARQAIRQRARSKDPRLRQAAIRASGLMGDREILPVVRQIFADAGADPALRLEAGRVLVRLAAAPELASLLKRLRSEPVSFRLHLARELVMRKYRPVVALLIDEIGEDQAWVRGVALELLRELTGQALGQDQDAWRAWWQTQKQ